MPDKTVALLIRFLEQNNGKLSNRARTQEFSALNNEEVELIEPLRVLKEADATVHIVAPHKGTIKAWDKDSWSDDYDVDKDLDSVKAVVYDALVLPGGVLNPDQLRTDTRAIQFVSHFLHNGKPISAICHGAQTLIETKELDGKTMTSYPSIKTDLINAGVNWVDEEVVVDKGLTTSRSPEDLPAFCDKMLEEISEGIHEDLKPT
ncbi:MAG: DJ-1/PfpI/YhbO family deglycase/protease [Bacteroidetes bacterium]|nr:DJ-1/PfpI/YhbO family deglycase/protease [Bacteroidota bacterium]